MQMRIADPEMKKEIAQLRAAHQTDMWYQQNLIKEEEAHLRTLLSAPERDKRAVEKTIDRMSAMKGDLLKKRLANQEEMKSILGPELAAKLKNKQQFRSKRGMQRMNNNRYRGSAMGKPGFENHRGKGFHGMGFDRPPNSQGREFGPGR